MGGETHKTGDDCFTGVKTSGFVNTIGTGSDPDPVVIDLGGDFFKRPLSKILIKITSGDGLVKLDKITKVIIPKCGEFKVVKEDNLLEVVMDDDKTDNDIEVTKQQTATTLYECNYGYIMQQNLDELCHITIRDDTDTYDNVYKVKLPDEKKYFAAGSFYTLTVELSKSETTITAKITDWKKVTYDEEIPAEL